MAISLMQCNNNNYMAIHLLLDINIVYKKFLKYSIDGN